ncbi:MAG: hypothetical protein IT327_06230 [Anaerolineae bacterium]|nr:hypothetical protein [Anaerolineae bacterium]
MAIPTAVPTSNPPAARPTWVEAARPHLMAITGASKIKKRNTVFDVAISQVLNTPMTWGRGTDHCARSIWLDSWQHEPQVQLALTAVLDTLQTERTNAAATAVDQAMVMLQEAAPQAAEVLISLLTATSNAKVLRLVANSILDRASKKTAVKQDDVEIPGLEAALSTIFGDEEA